jgi:hypothetical protein
MKTSVLPHVAELGDGFPLMEKFSSPGRLHLSKNNTNTETTDWCSFCKGPQDHFTETILLLTVGFYELHS